jgi:hypothetical protein
MDPATGKVSGFKITGISGYGKVYQRGEPIEGINFTALKTVDIKQMDYPGEIYLKTDSHSAVEFYCFGISFNVLPNSYFYYNSKTEELFFYNGEFYWKREARDKKGEISILEPHNVLTLSDSGRARIKENSVETWNFLGKLELNYQGEDFKIAANQLFVSASTPASTTYRDSSPGKSTNVFDIPPMAKNIDPASKEIVLEKPEDALIRFNWSNVRGAPRYVFRIYSSRLRENLLAERYVDTNRVNLDLLQFEERQFYWEVIPIGSMEDPREGAPSRMGHIRLTGAPFTKRDVQDTAELTIKSLIANGSLVIIKGEANPDSRLYINDKAVNLNLDGGFTYTLSFPTPGPQKILFKLVSPSGVETTEERYITIYEE